MFEIDLKKHQIFPWHNLNNSVFIRGNVYNSSGEIKQNSLLKQLLNINKSLDFINLIEKIDGSFSIIIHNKENDILFAASDRIRSFPLFYSKNNGRFIITDQINNFIKPMSANKVSAYEFIHTGYITNRNTLLDNVFQIQAGEYVCISSSKITARQYYNFSHHIDKKKEYGIYKSELKKSVNKIFTRLVNSTKEKPLVVPLSGGLDSRLIISNIHKLGKKEVTCFSYGLKNSREVMISKNIANDFGYKWHFINYGERKWKRWYFSDLMRKYFQFSGNLSSLPHIQDWPAVWELKEKNLIPNDSVFVPGHAADFVAGSHIPLNIQLYTKPDINVLIDLIIGEHFKLNKKISSYDYNAINLKLRNKLENQFSKSKINNIDDIADLYENWDWKERQAKFIANSCRVYEFWGYEWRMPFWDKEFIDLWRTVPLELRLGKKLYKEFLLDNDYNKIFCKYNYKNFERKDIKSRFKKTLIGSYLSELHKRYHGYHKFQYWDIISFKDIIIKYRDSYNFNSILAIEYLDSLKIKYD